MIDSHAHIYSKEFDTDRDEMLVRAKAQGVTKIFMPAIDSETHPAMLDAASKYPDFCLSMIGLHPCSVKENFLEEIDVIKELLKQHKFYGIGETGIDLYWDKTFVSQQKEALIIQAELALEYNLPLILHTRNATQETIDVIKTYQGTGLKGIFHCFGGTVEEAVQIIDLGFLLGIGGVASFKNGGLQQVLPHCSLENIVLETDAPYLAPTPYRGKRNEPAYLTQIVECIASIMQKEKTEVLDATSKNAEQLFLTK